MHPACLNKDQNHLQNSLLRQTQFWVRKTFSKPASLKRASVVAFPVAISHKVSVETNKILRFFNPDAKKLFKPNTVPKMVPSAQLTVVKEEESIFIPFLGPSGGTKKRDRKIAKTAKADPSKQKLQLRLFKQKANKRGPHRVSKSMRFQVPQTNSLDKARCCFQSNRKISKCGNTSLYVAKF